MQHYFIDKDHKEEDFFDFNDSVIGTNLCFRSCDSIFSKNKIDDGTRSLLEAIDNKITYLERISFGLITLDDSLKRGEWRYLTAEEEKMFTGEEQ